jgi:pimeloyl-ACP methyl ester carboxylesterase
VGNSIGAFATLLAASTAPSTACAGLVLLNAAGRFEERQPGEAPARKQAGMMGFFGRMDQTHTRLEWIII